MNKLFKSLGVLALGASLLASTAIASYAADFNLRATANSNENDEDYDGLVVFKNYVEAASNGKIGVELFIGTQLCSKGEECLQGVSDGTIDIKSSLMSLIWHLVGHIKNQEFEDFDSYLKAEATKIWVILS